MDDTLRVMDLGRIGYAAAYERQEAEAAAVLADREAGRPRVGTLFLLEHDPVVTVSRRASAAGNVVGSPELFSRMGVEVRETDRGGDVTYHGPGQLVGYAILDLNLLKLGLHEYMRLLEQSVIDAAARWGIVGDRDATATGVWVGDGSGAAKLCAFGVRVRRWVSMHGLGLNVDPDMTHFGLIVPCGLSRPVTSLNALLGDRCPTMDEVKREVAASLQRLLRERLASLT
ncbi:MAG: lipoyl(octanoyl) transferase LipB [Tepidisphaera sp.]